MRRFENDHHRGFATLRSDRLVDIRIRGEIAAIGGRWVILNRDSLPAGDDRIAVYIWNPVLASEEPMYAQFTVGYTNQIVSELQLA